MLIANMAEDGNNGEFDAEDLDSKWVAYGVTESSEFVVKGYVYEGNGYLVAYDLKGTYLDVAKSGTAFTSDSCKDWAAQSADDNG